MTKIRSELLLASKNKANGVTLFTFRLTMPRVLLAEINTHRVLSRSTSSSRAIPSKKMRAAVLNDPFIPVSLGSNQKGMQAGAEITGWRRQALLLVLKASRYPAVFSAWLMEKLGAHKQVSNRILEPHSWCTQIVSTTELDNFSALRNHDAAEPHLQELAALMQDQVERVKEEFDFIEKPRYSGPKSYGVLGVEKIQLLNPGEWHLPLIKPHEQWNPVEGLKKISAARCARTSYTLVETGKVSTPQDDLLLCDRLIESQHLSPFEHQAMAMVDSGDGFFGNFRSFKQFRKELEA